MTKTDRTCCSIHPRLCSTGHIPVVDGLDVVCVSVPYEDPENGALIVTREPVLGLGLYRRRVIDSYGNALDDPCECCGTWESIDFYLEPIIQTDRYACLGAASELEDSCNVVVVGIYRADHVPDSNEIEECEREVRSKVTKARARTAAAQGEKA